MMAPPPGEALQALLDLTDDQVRSLRRLQRERAVRLDEARLQLHQKQDNLLDLLEQEEPDGSALVSTVKSIHALRRQAREAEKEFQEKTSAILKEDQKTRWKSLQEAHQIPRAMREAARFDLVRPMEMGPGKPVPQR
jgi:Spy/CpxP family protein refolding chaperone